MNCDVLLSPKILRQIDCESFAAGELQTVGRVTGLVLQWNDAHAYQVTTMDPLKTLGKHSSYTLRQHHQCMASDCNKFINTEKQ